MKIISLLSISIIFILSCKLGLFFSIIALPIFFKKINSRLYKLAIFLFGFYLDLSFLTVFFSILTFVIFYFLDKKMLFWVMFPLTILIISNLADLKLRDCNRELNEFVIHFYNIKHELPHLKDIENKNICPLFINNYHYFPNVRLEYHRLSDNNYEIRPVGFFYNYLFLE